MKKESENHKKLIILAAVADKNGTVSILLKNLKKPKLSAAIGKRYPC